MPMNFVHLTRQLEVDSLAVSTHEGLVYPESDAEIQHLNQKRPLGTDRLTPRALSGLAIAFGLIPWLVPYAVRRLEVDRCPVASDVRLHLRDSVDRTRPRVTSAAGPS